MLLNKFKKTIQVRENRIFFIYILNYFLLKGLNVIKLKQDAVVTCDLQRDRVRVFYDDRENVAREPNIA
jgi:hypothetical protein